jgi:alkaline phosphatase D
MSIEFTRRELLRSTGILAATATFSEGMSGALADNEGARRESTGETTVAVPHGVQTGDVVDDRAIIWSRADRPSRLFVEVATDEDFADVRTLRGPAALGATDYTVKLDVTGLPRGEQIHYRVIFESLEEPGVRSDPVEGQFRTPPEDERDVRFAWGGDVAGQGWGIDQSRGGMTIFETIRQTDPDFFVHSGDAVYADGPLPETITLEDGTVWDNLVTDAKSEVADTLAEFRGNYKYNLLDDNYRQFVADVPMIAQWDDHEVTNNWYPDETLPADDPHDVKSVNLLSARGQRAFLEFMPVRTQQDNRDEHYASFTYGPSLEVFRLDLRSYRGPNTATLNEERSPATAILGEEQLAWLKESLAASDATWKVIASDAPIGLVIPDGENFEGIGNVDGEPRGREFEIADLLSFIRDEGVENVVWFTADVHYTAAHHYDPDRAQFSEFDPFWEFVTGPLHAGTFGPNTLDDTFGPEVVYSKAPPEGEANLPPSDGLQFFGQVDVDGDSEVMTVTLKDRDGTALFSTDLHPGEAGRRREQDEEREDGEARNDMDDRGRRDGENRGRGPRNRYGWARGKYGPSS